MRTRDPDGKRQALIQAGLTVAEREGLSQLSVNQVVAEAGIAKGSFFHLFGDRAAYLTEVHRRFHDRLASGITASTSGLEPGGDRLWAATVAYLDGCLQEKGTRALLIEAQAEPAVVSEVARRNQLFAQLAEPNFTALNWPNAAEAAQLWVVMARESAVAESAAGAALPRLRATLRGFLGS